MPCAANKLRALVKPCPSYRRRRRLAVDIPISIRRIEIKSSALLGVSTQRTPDPQCCCPTEVYCRTAVAVAAGSVAQTR